MLKQRKIFSCSKRVRQEKNNGNDKRKLGKKPIHGQCPYRVKKADVDKENTHKWLRSASLKGETEGFIIIAQDQSLATNNYRNKMVKDGTNPKCRLCHEYNETIEHISSGCSALAKKEYLERHDKALISMHWKMCKPYNIAVTSKWCEHKPSMLVEGKDVVVLWDIFQSILRRRLLPIGLIQ